MLHSTWYVNEWKSDWRVDNRKDSRENQIIRIFLYTEVHVFKVNEISSKAQLNACL